MNRPRWILRLRRTLGRALVGWGRAVLPEERAAAERGRPAGERSRRDEPRHAPRTDDPFAPPEPPEDWRRRVDRAVREGVARPVRLAVPGGEGGDGVPDLQRWRERGTEGREEPEGGAGAVAESAGREAAPGGPSGPADRRTSGRDAGADVRAGAAGPDPRPPRRGREEGWDAAWQRGWKAMEGVWQSVFPGERRGPRGHADESLRGREAQTQPPSGRAGEGGAEGSGEPRQEGSVGEREAGRRRASGEDREPTRHGPRREAASGIAGQRRRPRSGPQAAADAPAATWEPTAESGATSEAGAFQDRSGATVHGAERFPGLPSGVPGTLSGASGGTRTRKPSYTGPGSAAWPPLPDEAAPGDAGPAAAGSTGEEVGPHLPSGASAAAHSRPPGPEASSPDPLRGEARRAAFPPAPRHRVPGGAPTAPLAPVWPELPPLAWTSPGPAGATPGDADAPLFALREEERLRRLHREQGRL